MSDFMSLLKKPLDDIKKPQALPAGLYPGQVKKYEFVEAPPGKEYKKIVRYHFGLTGWADGIDEGDKMEDLGSGLVEINLAKRQLRRDFYDNSLHRLKEFLESFESIQTSGHSMEECLAMVVGLPVQIEVKQYMNQRTNEIGNEVGGVTGG